jgi:microcystin-dependent protein
MAAGPVIPSSPSAGDDSGYVRSSLTDLFLTLSGPTAAIPRLAISLPILASSRNSSSDSTPNQYAFTPHFLFTPVAADGSQFTRTSDPALLMRLALYSGALQSKAAAYISSQIGAQVLAQNVQVLPISQFTITEQTIGTIYTSPFNFVLQPVQDIKTQNLSQTQVDALASSVTNGSASFTFFYTFEDGSNTINSATITYKQIQSNSVFQQLTGPGSATSVTRNGLVRVGTSIAMSVAVTSYVEDPGTQDDLIDKVINLLFDKAQYQSDIDYTSKQNMATLSSLSIDPRGPDFEAAQIDSTHDALTKSSDVDDVKKNMLDLGAGGGYGGFSVSDTFKDDSDVENAIKTTFDHDWTGNNYSTVPKTVCVYQLNSGDFASNAAVDVVSITPRFAPITKSISPSQVFPSLADIAAMVAAPGAESFVLVPIGTITAFSGDAASLDGANWLVCDGRPLSAQAYPALYALLGARYGDGRNDQNIKIPSTDFNLPDYRGYFLRGVNSGSGRDPEAQSRIAPGTGSSVSGDAVGTVQSFATSLPHNQFGSDYCAPHSHTYPLEVDSCRSDGASPTATWTGKSTTDPAGGHSHQITSGGDMETRPVNIAVFWIIRAV